MFNLPCRVFYGTNSVVIFDSHLHHWRLQHDWQATQALHFDGWDVPHHYPLMCNTLSQCSGELCILFGVVLFFIFISAQFPLIVSRPSHTRSPQVCSIWNHLKNMLMNLEKRMLAPLQIWFATFASSVNSALQREAAHALAGHSDHKNGSLEDPACMMAKPAPSSNQGSAGHPPMKQAWYYAHRRAKWAMEKRKQPGVPRPLLSKKHLKPKNFPIHFNAKNLWVVKDAFISQCQPCKQSKECTLDKLVTEGFKVIKWDGQ